MTINYNILNEDIVNSVDLSVSPIEYLIISSALMQFIENNSNHQSDIEIAKCMRITIEQEIKNDGDGNCSG